MRDDDDDDPREASEFPFHVIINPSYEPIGTETRSFYEGCLSFDGYQAVRKRWLDITARWQDEDGKQHEEHLHGWPARIFQHETDHLSGELYIDKAEIRSLATNENLEDSGATIRFPPKPPPNSDSNCKPGAHAANRIHARRKTLRNPIVTESYRCAIRGISCRGRGPQASPFLSYRHFFVIPPCA